MEKKPRLLMLVVVLVGISLLTACGVPAYPAASPLYRPQAAGVGVAPGAVGQTVPTAQNPTVEYTLVTGGSYGGLVFVGMGGEIDNQVNPTLAADPGDVVKITVINGDGIVHDFTIDEFGVQTPQLQQRDDRQEVIFAVEQEGEYVYYCSLPGHRQAGMFGLLRVGNPAPVAAATGASIIRDPADVPPPVGDRAATTVRVDLTTREVVGQLADGTTYSYFTFGGAVPGPMIRVRVGDTVDLHLHNEADSHFSHSIDLHAVTGPGGGAVYTRTDPGQETSFTFRALNVGLYVYHCATTSVAHHITNGMYGLILVEPVGGLPPVDREFYVMQGELYTEQPFGTTGHLDFSMEKMSHEQPEYFVFNGAAGGLATDAHALRANVGETVRIFFGVGGPNATSSFHVIGEIFDRVYEQASLTASPLTDVQTTTVPPGGAAMVEFTLEVPGRYILVDHALSRLERGLVGYLYVEGEEQPEIFHSEAEANMAGH